VGFAACDRVFGIDAFENPKPQPPVVDSATGKDAVTIEVVWEPGIGWQTFQIERTDPNGVITPLDSPALPLKDTGRDPATTYSYQVRGFDMSGDPSDLSASVSGTTLPVVSTYAKTLTDSSENWQKYTLVQRIEAAHLSATGPHVRITLQASPASDASIDKVYISQAAASGNLYDSAGDLTVVYDLAANQGQPFVVPAGMQKSLPIVAYAINSF